jgi:hypothetical protein
MIKYFAVKYESVPKFLQVYPYPSSRGRKSEGTPLLIFDLKRKIGDSSPATE